ncbi:MAG: transglycosylase SLT domain-containing protein [Thiovulaceae bacterium]|nr:transglycosylase SLT domain-containing protein [Sulfurimonadaceae bacterium]MCW9026502.1 transglycosylase SLT domain-containing protein [Sulfurimonadaceae bacterium]
MKYFLLLLIPFTLFGNLNYAFNHNEEIKILDSFDIETSFLLDKELNDMRVRNSQVYRSKHFFHAMDHAYIYIPAVKKVLAQYNIPPEFLYLAMAESNFSNRAYSKKRAAGLWQFMPATGKSFGLKIDEYVDERRDPIKSTKAAAKYLSSLHKRFGKWYLAAIAYNCGGGRLSKAIRKAGSDDLSILLNKKKKYLPRESRMYIRKIVSFALLGNDDKFLLESEYGHILNRASAFSMSTIKLPSGESLKRVAKTIDLPLKTLKKLNRHLKYDFVPPYKKDYEIYIPYVKINDFKQKYTRDSVKNIYKIHVVSNGDNLSYIGKKYGVPYKVIMDFNNLKHSRLKLKQKLIVPIDLTSKAKKINTKHYYLVKKGDTLESISRSHKVSIKNLQRQNRLSGSLIKVGERLKIYE